MGRKEPSFPWTLHINSGSLVKSYHCSSTSHGGQQLGPNPDEVVLAFKETGASHVVVPHAPVGPASTWLEGLKTSLKAHGIAHEQPMRRYDELVWPHAKKGFFPVKKQIPSILEELGLV